jgi:hypothetical protein
MPRKYPGYILIIVLVILSSASFISHARAECEYSNPYFINISENLLNYQYSVKLDRMIDQRQVSDQQARTPRPTSTPIPIPPPPDPGSVNLMVFFGLIVVLIILFGVWINRQRSEKKEY